MSNGSANMSIAFLCPQTHVFAVFMTLSPLIPLPFSKRANANKLIFIV